MTSEQDEAFRRASHPNVTLAQSLTLLKGRAGDTPFAHRCTPTDDLAFELLCNLDTIIAALALLYKAYPEGCAR